jgi:hypothetical protein
VLDAALTEERSGKNLVSHKTCSIQSCSPSGKGGRGWRYWYAVNPKAEGGSVSPSNHAVPSSVECGSGLQLSRGGWSSAREQFRLSSSEVWSNLRPAVIVAWIGNGDEVRSSSIRSAFHQSEEREILIIQSRPKDAIAPAGVSGNAVRPKTRSVLASFAQEIIGIYCARNRKIFTVPTGIG